MTLGFVCVLVLIFPGALFFWRLMRQRRALQFLFCGLFVTASICVCLFACLYCGRICNARERAQAARTVVFEIMSFLWCQLCVCRRCRHARCAHTKVLKSKVGATLSPMCGCGGGGGVCFFAVAARHNNVGTVYNSLCHAIERNRRALIAQRWTLSRSLNSPFNCFVFAHEGCIKSFKVTQREPHSYYFQWTANFVRRKS